MTRTSPPQVAFSSGELDPLLHRRFDYVKYQTGLAVCRGFLPLAQGGFTRMPGTWHQGETKGNLEGRLIPFTFAANDSVVLEFTNLKMRVWRYGQLVMSGASPYELTTPYDLAAVRRLNFVQSADVIRIVDGQLPMQRLARFALDNWTIGPETFNAGPFRIQNLNKSRKIQASADSGTVTLTATWDFFTDAHVGSLLKLQPSDNTEVALWTSNTNPAVGALRRFDGKTYELISTHATNGIGENPPRHFEGDVRVDNDGPVIWRFRSDDIGVVRILSRISATQATAQVLRALPRGCVTDPTYRWSEGAWSEIYGYPSSIEIYDQRLAAAGTETDPRMIWFSAIGRFTDFMESGLADEGFAYTIAGDSTVNSILNLRRGKTGLHIFALGEEYSTRSDSRDQAIGPKTAFFTHNGSEGASGARPITVDGNPVFISRDGRRVVEIAYSFQDDANLTRQLSLPAQHLGNDAFQEIAWQNSPMKIAWLRQASGQLAAMIYNKAEEVLGWCTLPLAGGSVESLAVTPDATGTRDAVTMIVRRTVNGITKRYVEELAENFTILTGDDPAMEANHLFAASRITAPSPTSAFTVPHLAGATVHAWTDEGMYGPLTVASDGAVALPDELGVSQAIIGLFDETHRARTLDIVAAAPDGNTLGRQKRLYSGAGIGLHRTVAGLVAAVEGDIGRPERVMKPVQLLPRQAADAMTAAYTGVVSAPAPTGHAKEVALEFTPTGGAPLTITAVVPTVQEAGR